MNVAAAPIEILMRALFARLSHYCEIGDAECDALLALPMRERVYEPGDDVIEKGEEPTEALIVKSGWAARYVKIGRAHV